MPPRKLIALGATFIFVAIPASWPASPISAQGLARPPPNPERPPKPSRPGRKCRPGCGCRPAPKLAEQFGLALGPWSGLVQYQLTEHRWDPLIFAMTFGPETLALYAVRHGRAEERLPCRQLGRAALRTGRRAWLPDRRPDLLHPCCADFPATASTPVGLFDLVMAATVLVRPIMIVAVAALVILLTDQGGWLVDRIAAAGRAAFTNYLGTSILMTGALLWLGPRPVRRASAGSSCGWW